MTSHTITDPVHRFLGNPTAKFGAWIKTGDGYLVELQIGSNATQEQAKRFVREAVAAPELLEALIAVHEPYKHLTEEALRAGIFMEHGPPKPEKGLALLAARAAIVKATGGEP